MLKYEGNSPTVTIDFVLIGTPAWNSKKIHKGDVLVAVDGHEEKGEAMIAKLLGAHGTSVTLTIKKEGGDEHVDVELQRMATSLVADKRKMFDLFTAIEHRFLMDKDMIGKKHNDDALAFWTQMCMEEIDQDNRCVCLNPVECFPWASTGSLFHSLIPVLSLLSIFCDLGMILTDVGPMWRPCKPTQTYGSANATPFWHSFLVGPNKRNKLPKGVARGRDPSDLRLEQMVVMTHL
jgi:hypothetical protein